MTRALVHVVAGALIDPQGRVLIAQRPAGKHLAGGWEFPGGKLEPGEERRIGLARELREELGVTIGVPRPLVRVRHAYPSRDILLDMWVVKNFTGEPQGLDGQALRWCPQEELGSANLLPADEPIVAALRLPERLLRADTAEYQVREKAELDTTVVGQLRGVYCSSFAEGAAAVAAGASFLVMRHAVPAEVLAGLCESVPLPVFAREVSLRQAWDMGASGINVITQ